MGVLIDEEGFPRRGIKRHHQRPRSHHDDPWNRRYRAEYLPAGQAPFPQEASRDDVQCAHTPRTALPRDDGVPSGDVEPAPIPGAR